MMVPEKVWTPVWSAIERPHPAELALRQAGVGLAGIGLAGIGLARIGRGAVVFVAEWVARPG